MNKVLMVTVKNVYGKELIYPVNDVAQTFADISGQKTLSRETLKHAQTLGFVVEVETQVLKLV